MASRTARSLRHEYELYLEQEIENYKESIPRAAILAIGDEAVARLASEPQFVLTELLLLEEVDRIIFRRLRLPKYDTWRRKRLKLHDEMRRPEHWGFSKTDALVRTLRDGAAKRGSGHILVAGEATQRSALFLAANGCDVTALESEENAVRRVLEAAIQAGLTEKVHAVAADLGQWKPDSTLQAVVFTHGALNSLPQRERARVIGMLQGATADGGVHLVETIVAGAHAIEELRATYRGWDITIEPSKGLGQVFFARKDDARSSVSH